MDFTLLIPLFEMAVVTWVLAIALGYFMDRLPGAIALFGLATVAIGVCFVGALLGLLGLLAAVLIVAATAALVGRILSGRRGQRCFSMMWLGWSIFCLVGYHAAGLAGLVLITLPAVALFWAGAYALAQVLLPFGDHASTADRLLGLRAFLTYALGTNYPYYAIENQQKIPRVSGNVRRRFLAGPGLIITGCDHTVLTSDGITLKDVKSPGLSFTGRYETIAEVIDLRFQQRAFEVEALTKDGIRIKVMTSVPFRIYAGSDQPEPGKPFPFRKSAILKAIMRGQPIEHSRAQLAGMVVESKQRHAWDEMVGIVATQIVRRIISQYSFDGLCALNDPSRNPRQEIVDKLRQQLREELEPIGIQMLGGGIANLMPADDKLLRQRVSNWQADWDLRIAAETGKGDAEYIRMIESARAQAQVDMIQAVSEGVEQAGSVGESVLTEVIALRFIETLEKMIQSPNVQPLLPASSVETVGTMRHLIEGRSL